MKSPKNMNTRRAIMFSILLTGAFMLYAQEETSNSSDQIDIWNLPPLKIEQGHYTENWDTLSKLYNVPEWWREAKLGAWSHWDPQSAAEDGDWYSRGMYMPNNEQYRYHLEHYGHPSEYGYKDLCNDWVIDRWDQTS